MLESGHSIADYQIVTPLTENPLFATYQVTGAGVDSARLLLFASDTLADKKSRQAFIDQAQVLLGQSFPGLCSLLAADVTAEGIYCLYPFPFGDALAERLTVPISVRRSLEMVKLVATHLGSAHAAGLWHGSISPSTLYLDVDSVSLDLFALASLLRLDFHSGVDPCYGSPELVRGEPLSSASDLYSLGIVLYRLLAGAVPFSGDDPFAIAMMHVQEEPAPLPASLSLLQPLIDGLLHTVPAERWSAEQLVGEIEQYLQLPQLDSIELVVADKPEVVEELPAEEMKSSKIEKLMEDSDLAARIERRLQERAEVLQESEELTPDAKRASTARMSAISQKSYRKTQDMKNNRYQHKSTATRFFLLIAVGVAVGVIIYLALFRPSTTSLQEMPELPEALSAGLESGSRLLEQGDVAAAEKTFTALVADYALFPQPYNNLAAVYARQGDLERSRNILERAMATDESYATVYRNLGTVYSEMARDSYGRALQLEKGQQAVTLQVFDGTQLVAISTVAAGEKTLATVTEETAAERDVVPATLEMQSEKPVAVPASTVQTNAATETVTAGTDEEPDAVTEPVAEVVLAPEPESAETFLLRWAAAWSAQDVPAYLDFYATDFTPPAGNSREDWTEQRQRRISRPKSIEITLEDFALSRQTEEQLQLEVTQGYKSDRYADRTRKIFDLIREGNSWRIVRERSLGRVR